ncbi:MAG TPA: hypothetical protein PKC49_12070, partial [Phycisphaerae bacterium]|nr:hypothetical protein [Phycisphaerae bacterium]
EHGARGQRARGARGQRDGLEIPSGNLAEGEVLRRLAAQRSPRVIEFLDAGRLPELIAEAVREYKGAFIVVSESQAGAAWREVLLGGAGERRLVSETWRVHVAYAWR